MYIFIMSASCMCWFVFVLESIWVLHNAKKLHFWPHHEFLYLFTPALTDDAQLFYTLPAFISVWAITPGAAELHITQFGALHFYTCFITILKLGHLTQFLKLSSNVLSYSPSKLFKYIINLWNHKNSNYVYKYYTSHTEPSTRLLCSIYFHNLAFLFDMIEYASIERQFYRIYIW